MDKKWRESIFQLLPLDGRYFLTVARKIPNPGLQIREIQYHEEPIGEFVLIKGWLRYLFKCNWALFVWFGWYNNAFPAFNNLKFKIDLYCIHFQDFIRITELALLKFCLVRSSVYFYQSFIDVRVGLSNLLRNISNIENLFWRGMLNWTYWPYTTSLLFRDTWQLLCYATVTLHNAD